MLSYQTQILLLAVGAILYVAVIYLPSRRKSPPGPKGWPLIGNLLDLAPSKGNLVPTFTAWTKTYGPIVQFKIFREKQIILSDEATVHELFVKRGAIYSDRNAPHAFRVMTNEISVAMMPKNDAWRRERKLIHSAMNISINKKYQAAMSSEAILALSDLLATPHDFDAHFHRYSYGVIARCFFGVRIASASDAWVVSNQTFINKVMDAFDPTQYPSNVLTWLRYLPKGIVTSLREMERMRDLNDSMVRTMREGVEKQMHVGEKETEQDSIYASFLANRDEYDISDEEAGSAFFALIGGGTRSTHNALMAFIYLMMAYPEWQTKLQKHIEEVVGSERLPTWEDIPNLPMVRAVVKEEIRYRTIAAELGIPHRLEVDDEFEGWKFEKGTVFHANYGAILMDPKTYPDQHPFNPARWLEPSYPTFKAPLTVYPNCQNFAPFGYGRRACPGYDFAERSLLMMVANMAWSCDIKRPIDPVTKQEVLPKMSYEATPNPRPFPFGCRIVPRNRDRVGVVEREAKRCKE